MSAYVSEQCNNSRIYGAKCDFQIDKSRDFDRIHLKESPAVSGRSKSGDAAAVALLSKGYGDIALVIFYKTWGLYMEQGVFNVYWIDMKYIRNLHNIDDRIFSVSPQVGKEERPFLGIILVCNDRKYCVPLSKPKKKHENMRDKIDFKRIIVDGKLIGVLNFNLMIPVEEEQLHRIDTVIRKHDNVDTKRKKERLIKELKWCNEHERDLVNTARVLYQKYNSGDKFSAREQCIDFKKMEEACEKFNSKN